MTRLMFVLLMTFTLIANGSDLIDAYQVGSSTVKEIVHSANRQSAYLAEHLDKKP